MCLQDGAVTTEKNKGLSEPQGPVEWREANSRPEENHPVRKQSGACDFGASHNFTLGTGSGVQKDVKPIALRSLLFPLGMKFTD